VNLVSTLVRQLKEIKKSATAKVRSAMVIKNHRQVQDQAASPQVVNMVEILMRNRRSRRAILRFCAQLAGALMARFI